MNIKKNDYVKALYLELIQRIFSAKKFLSGFKLCIRVGYLLLHSIRRTKFQAHTKLSIDARYLA